MPLINFTCTRAATVNDPVYVRVAGRIRILSCAWVQNGTTVAIHGSNHRTITLKDGDANTIGTITTNTGGTALTKGAATAIPITNPTHAVIAKDEIFELHLASASGGAVLDGTVCLEVENARSY